MQSDITKRSLLGPVSSTDNAIVRSDGITGKRTQNSSVLIDDNGGTVFTNSAATVGANYEIRENNNASPRLAYNVPTGMFHEFDVNGSAVVYYGTGGFYTAVPIANISSGNNSQITLASTGTSIARNIADNNSALIVNQIHASATGAIVDFQASSSSRLKIDRGGGAIWTGAGSAAIAGNYEIRKNSDATPRMQINVPTGALVEASVADVTVLNISGAGLFVNNVGNRSTFSNSQIQLATNGAIIDRNIADANPALIIQQIHASSTGDIVQFKNNVGVVASISQSGLLRRSTTAGITASTTQTQGQGPLTTDINQISVCANANDTVTLPSAVAGLDVVVINDGAQTLRIFPASGDNLGAGVDTATTLIAGSQVRFMSYDATNWVQF